MLRTRFWKLTAIASALALAAMAPAAAAGGPPDDRGGAGGSQMKAGGVYAAAPMAPGEGPGGPGGGSGGGGGRPDDPGGGEDTESAGNNLSYPVLWSEDGYLLTLRTADEMPVFDGASGSCTEVSGQAALQQDAKNVWQADNLLAANVTNTIDWGDALEATDANSKMQRVEVSLYSNLPTDAPMLGYDMCKTNNETGPDEMWGAITSGDVPIEFLDAMVYTAGGRLTIQRIVPDRTYTWNTSLHQWTGSGADDPVFNAAVHERTSDGPGTFGVEVTISGKITYGYVWSTDRLPLGEYRLTFSLDGPEADFPVGSGTDFTADTTIAVPEEETVEELVAAAAEDEAGGAPGANTAVLRDDLNLTYIDVGLGTRTDPIPPVDEPTTPPATGGGTSTPAAPVSTEQTPADQGGQPEVTNPQLTPQAASALFVQKAKITALKSGKYPVGKTIVLAKKRVKTSAGVTVRWRATVRSQDNCTVKIRKSDGKATVALIKPGRCRVVAWAPPASPDWTGFRETRTYRVRNMR